MCKQYPRSLALSWLRTHYKTEWIYLCSLVWCRFKSTSSNLTQKKKKKKRLLNLSSFFKISWRCDGCLAVLGHEWPWLRRKACWSLGIPMMGGRGGSGAGVCRTCCAYIRSVANGFRLAREEKSTAEASSLSLFPAASGRGRRKHRT